MRPETKRHIITLLYLVTAAAAIASIVIGALILVHISRNQTANHNDTTSTDNLIICMLEVPVKERTADYANHCRTTAATQTPAAVAATAVTDNPASPAAATPAAIPTPTVQTTPGSTSQNQDTEQAGGQQLGVVGSLLCHIAPLNVLPCKD